MVKAKKLIEGGTAILLLLILGVMMTGLTPSFADSDGIFDVSSSSEWDSEAGSDTINIEYATDSQHEDVAEEGLIRWNGTDEEGLWDSQEYDVSGDRVRVEYEYLSENDSDVTLRVVDEDSDETLKEENLSATGLESTDEKTLTHDLEEERDVTVEFELTSEKAEVYEADVSDETDNMTSTIVTSVIGLMVLGGLTGAFLKM